MKIKLKIRMKIKMKIKMKVRTKIKMKENINELCKINEEWKNFLNKKKSRRLYKSITKNDCIFNFLQTIKVIF
jgi:hypothetical protein